MSDGKEKPLGLLEVLDTVEYLNSVGVDAEPCHFYNNNGDKIFAVIVKNHVALRHLI
jgi:hypothetical protein